MNAPQTQHFLDLLKAMRNAQKQYFKTRKKDDLITAKRLETAVDAWIKSIDDPR